MTDLPPTLINNALWVVVPGLSLVVTMVLLFRAETKAYNIKDEIARSRRLNFIDLMHQFALSCFIVFMLWRTQTDAFTYPYKWSLKDILENLYWIGLFIAFGTICTLKPGEAKSPDRLALRAAIVTAFVAVVLMLPLAVKSVGAPPWSSFVVLFTAIVLWLKHMPTSRTPAQRVADTKIAEDAAARLTLAQRADIEALLRNGRYIEAVRDLRDALALDLRSAKNAADLLRDRLRESS